MFSIIKNFMGILKYYIFDRIETIIHPLDQTKKTLLFKLSNVS